MHTLRTLLSEGKHSDKQHTFSLSFPIPEGLTWLWHCDEENKIPLFLPHPKATSRHVFNFENHLSFSEVHFFNLRNAEDTFLPHRFVVTDSIIYMKVL